MKIWRGPETHLKAWPLFRPHAFLNHQRSRLVKLHFDPQGRCNSLARGHLTSPGLFFLRFDFLPFLLIFLNSHHPFFCVSLKNICLFVYYYSLFTLYPGCSPLHLLLVPLLPLYSFPSPLTGEDLLPFYLILAYQVSSGLAESSSFVAWQGCNSQGEVIKELATQSMSET